MTYFVLCEDDCRHEGMSKEQILATIANASGGIMTDTETGKYYVLYVSDGKLNMKEYDGEAPSGGIEVSEAIITKVKERNTGGYIYFWVGTQDEYNKLTEIDANCHYHITDSKEKEELNKFLSHLQAECDMLSDSVSDVQQAVNAAQQTADAAQQKANEVDAYANNVGARSITNAEEIERVAEATETAYFNAQTAQKTADTALATANEAKSSAASAVGMAREFDSGLIETKSYTTPGKDSKFYIVTLDFDGNRYTQVVDYKSVQAQGNSAGYRVSGWVATEGAWVHDVLSAKRNSTSGKITFSTTDAKIIHVAGYY